MFKKISKMKFKYRILFSILIGSAVVSFWRGVWHLMDIYLLPNNPGLSGLISLLLGILVLVVTDYTVKELM